jgi:hypothetical protein
MSPGRWNNYIYSKEEILKAYKNTDWEDRYNTALYLDHEDTLSRCWIGDVKNIRADTTTGFIMGDLYIYDPSEAVKLAMGKPKCGVSPKVEGMADGDEMMDFTFKNFSEVINPAVKTAFINNSDIAKAPTEREIKVDKDVLDRIEEDLPNYFKDHSDDKMIYEWSAKKGYSTNAVHAVIYRMAVRGIKSVTNSTKTEATATVVGEHSNEVSIMTEEQKVDAPAAVTAAAQVENAVSATAPASETATVQKMSESEVLTRIVNIMREAGYFEMGCATKKAEEQKPEEEKKPAGACMSQEVSKTAEADKVILELSKKVSELEAKLNEPEERMIVENTQQSTVSADAGLLKMLQSRI